MGLTRNFLRRFVLLTLGLTAILSSTLVKGATVDVSPARVGNDYTGFVTLQVAGLATNETVVVQKYLDVNSNGVVDATDLFVQQFQITDGAGASMIGGATNVNVPYDSNGPDGIISARLCLNAEGVLHRIVGRYVYVVSSPSNNFATVTQMLVVTNAAYGQSISGTVLSNSVAAPFASVFVMANDDFSDQGWMTGVVADSAGQYSISVPVGNYTIFGWQRGCAGEPVYSAEIDASTTVITNLDVVAADTIVSGRAVDSHDSNIGLGGLFLTAMGDGYGVAVTDSNGNFSLPVNAGEQWVSTEPFSCSSIGYLSVSETNISAWTNISGLQLSYSNAEALVYGRAVDDNNNPLAGVRLDMHVDGAYGGYSGFRADQETVTDGDGRYALPVSAGSFWDITIDAKSVPATVQNDLLPAVRDWTVATSNGFAYQQDLVAMRPTQILSGFLRDNTGLGIAGVAISANAMMGNVEYSANTVTDSTGYYSLNVIAGQWFVSVPCGSGFSGALSSVYACPPMSAVTVSNADAALDITVSRLDGFLAGRVVDEFGVPLTTQMVSITAVNPPPNGGRPTRGDYAFTSTNGAFQLPIASGSYTLKVDGYGIDSPGTLQWVSPVVSVTIPAGGSVTNVTLVVKDIVGSVTVTVTNIDTMQPVANASFTGSAAINGTNYSSAGASTDTNGVAILQVCNGDWRVGPFSTYQLGYLGVTTPDPQTAHVTNNNVTLNFLVHGTPAPRLSLPLLNGASQFQVHFNGNLGGYYILQSSTNLTNWTTVGVTNANSADVLMVDTNAADGMRFYRVLQGL